MPKYTLGGMLGMHAFPTCRAHGRVKRKIESGRSALVDTLRARCGALLPEFDLILEQEEAVRAFLHQ